jgi:hypothetical protein
MSLPRRRTGWILVRTNRYVTEDIRVIGNDTDSLGHDVEWNAIHRLNVLSISKLMEEISSVAARFRTPVLGKSTGGCHAQRQRRPK